MEPSKYYKMVKKRGYHGLQLVHMTITEAKKFAGRFGMNAILYNKKDMSMDMTRLYNTENGFCYTDREYFGTGNLIKLDPKTYDIYWIGGK